MITIYYSIISLRSIKMDREALKLPKKLPIIVFVIKGSGIAVTSTCRGSLALTQSLSYDKASGIGYNISTDIIVITRLCLSYLTNYDVYIILKFYELYLLMHSFILWAISHTFLEPTLFVIYNLSPWCNRLYHPQFTKESQWQRELEDIACKSCVT